MPRRPILPTKAKLEARRRAKPAAVVAPTPAAPTPAASPEAHIFSFVAMPTRNKTAIITVTLSRSQVLAGTIRWNGQYRQYAFEPTPATIYTVRALRELETQVQALMDQWSAKNKNRRFLSLTTTE